MCKMKDSGIEWIGEMPEDWKVDRNKNVLNCSKQIVGTKSVNTTLLSLTTHGIRIKNVNENGGKQPETFDTYQIVKPNDLIMCLFDLDCSAVFSGISKDNGMISPAYKVLNCREGLLPNYADYWFMYVFIDRKFKAYAKNLRYTLNYDEFAVLPIIYPNLNEQQKIADFLDEKCADIDAAISEAEASIEDYKLLKQSVITQAVTKGLDHNAKMKGSGIEWIGEIPKDWKISINKAVLRNVTVKNHPESTVLSLYRDYGVLPKDSRDDNHNVTSEKTEEYKFVKIGNLVINKMKAWQGSLGVSKYEGIVSPAYYVCEFTNNLVSKEFFHYFIRNKHNAQYFESMSAGLRIGQWDLNIHDFLKAPLLVPSTVEQKEIVVYLDKRCAEIDKLVVEKQEIIEELKAYKKSLIFEYVTGKKEVA